jgi:hypothetical protein
MPSGRLGVKLKRNFVAVIAYVPAITAALKEAMWKERAARVFKEAVNESAAVPTRLNANARKSTRSAWLTITMLKDHYARNACNFDQYRRPQRRNTVASPLSTFRGNAYH